MLTVGNQAAQAALEMALWDLQGKALGRPLCDLLGGRTRDGLVEEVTWGWDAPAALAEKTRRMRVEGVTAFKIKAGDAPERDEQRVAAVREAAGPDARLTVDVNQGWWDARTAVRGVRLLTCTTSRSSSSRCAWTIWRRPGSCASASTCPSRSTRA